MYLKQLHIHNFRAFKDITLYFQKGLNILIGENNSGKSTVIDVLRICLGRGKSETPLYLCENDLYVNTNDSASTIEFDLIFDDLTDAERACFYDCISQDKNDPLRQTAQIHFRFTRITNSQRKYFKSQRWGGDNEGQSIPEESLQEIFYTYLAPLRDAISQLHPFSRNNKTAQLFEQLTQYKNGEKKFCLLNENKKNELVTTLNSLFNNDGSDWKYILTSGEEKVNEHLLGSGINHKHPHVQLNYVGRTFSDVVRGIEIKSITNSQTPFDLSQNGLGENNLIYASVVLGDLINRCENEELEMYNALLVEEPEAHLHPQYQNTFFEYLNTLQDKGLQIFMTSHSPTLTAKSDLGTITILQRQEGDILPFSFSSLPEEDYSIKDKNLLRRFLDTTKSQLFFANGVIIVEGLAEAILLPILASKLPSIDLCKDGIEIVNINGVSFEYFAKLFNNDDPTKRLLSQCAIITDSDSTFEEPISDRAKKVKNMEKNNLHVFLAPHTFEYDLFEESKHNTQIMKEVYTTMHKQFNMDCDVDAFMDKLQVNKDKGEFALLLGDRLKTEDFFGVPQYIKDAIKVVIPSRENEL